MGFWYWVAIVVVALAFRDVCTAFGRGLFRGWKSNKVHPNDLAVFLRDRYGVELIGDAGVERMTIDQDGRVQINFQINPERWGS